MYLNLDAFSLDELGRTILDVTGTGFTYDGAGAEAIEDGDLFGLFLLLGHIELLCTDWGRPENFPKLVFVYIFKIIIIKN